MNEPSESGYFGEVWAQKPTISITHPRHGSSAQKLAAGERSACVRL